MRNFFQALKLQITSSLTYYLLDLLFVILATVLIYFFKNTFVFYVLVLAWCFIFTFVLGNTTYKIYGKTYYALKHDRRYFVSSSILSNFLNAIIMTAIYIAIVILRGYGLNILCIISMFILHLACYSLGAFYSLYLSKFKYLKFFLVLVIIVALLFTYESILGQFELLFNHDVFTLVLEFKYQYLYSLVSFVLFIFFNILNKCKYLK